MAAIKVEMTEHGKKFKNPLKAIRVFCGTCICGGIKQIEKCDADDCELRAYRLGKNPFSQRRVLSQEQRDAASERFKKMHAGKKKSVPKKSKKEKESKPNKTDSVKKTTKKERNKK